MGTIVQKYGPIYGEAVNGTVQGRPNGSYYVPISNTIEFEVIDAKKYVLPNGGIVKSDGTQDTVNNPIFSAIAQDLSSNVQAQLYSDEECTTLVAYRNFARGLFNTSFRYFSTVVTAPTVGEMYYMRVQLMNNNTPIATSDAYEVECV